MTTFLSRCLAANASNKGKSSRDLFGRSIQFNLTAASGSACGPHKVASFCASLLWACNKSWYSLQVRSIVDIEPPLILIIFAHLFNAVSTLFWSSLHACANFLTPSISSSAVTSSREILKADNPFRTSTASWYLPVIVSPRKTP